MRMHTALIQSALLVRLRFRLSPPPSEPWLFEDGMNDTRIKSAEPLVLIVLRTPSPHAIMDVSSWL